jgi:hypothetical protein
MITVYVSIGNSDDKLTQDEWRDYQLQVRAYLRTHAQQVHGEWYSTPTSKYQNACFCVVLRDGDRAELVKMGLAEIRESFRQDSVAWAEVPVTNFI